MDARTTTGQVGLDGQPARLAERFDDHVGWAYRFGMVDNWEVLRCELHAVLTLALRLDRDEVDPEDLVAVARLGQQQRDLELILEQARATADPIGDWRGCYDAIWELAARSGLIGAAPGIAAPYGRAGTAEPTDGIPDRMLDWMLRTMFLRDLTQLARTAPIDNWARLAPALHRQLTGTWALETRWTDRNDREHEELVATRRQQLQVLLATAQQHFDPAADWEAFREYLWCCRDRVTMRHAVCGPEPRRVPRARREWIRERSSTPLGAWAGTNSDRSNAAPLGPRLVD